MLANVYLKAAEFSNDDSSNLQLDDGKNDLLISVCFSFCSNCLQNVLRNCELCQLLITIRTLECLIAQKRDCVTSMQHLHIMTSK